MSERKLLGAVQLGPRAFGRLSHLEATNSMRCEGILVADAIGGELFASTCKDPQLVAGQYCIGQHERFRAGPPDRVCCLPCAIEANAIDPREIVAEVQRWLNSEAGRQSIRRRLPDVPDAVRDDLVTAVIHDAMRNTATGFRIRRVPGWCLEHIRWRSDAVMGGYGVVAEVLPDYVKDPEEPSVEQFVVPTRRAEFREQLAVCTVEPWVRSAMLTLFAVEMDGSEPGEHCPAPRQGADEQSRHEAAALWYAGQYEAFLERPGQTAAALRQRRARLARPIRELMTRITESLEECPGA